MVWNFYHSANTEYFTHELKPHYNFGNKLMHSDLYKKLNPLRQNYDYQPNGEMQQLPFYFGHIPQLSWVYGNLDYAFNKYHRHYQDHDDWYPDRKAKTLGHKNGSHVNPNMKQSKFMTLQAQTIPRGCYREIRKYQACAGDKGKNACTNEKISIMEVCPDHVLEGLREKRKWYLRAQAIDNETYKRAMTVSAYNAGRSVSDLTVKDWTAGMPQNLRPDGTWVDDRYDPMKHDGHPHRHDSVNFPEMEYSDVFGGTLGTAAQAERDHHDLGFSGKSAAMFEAAQNKVKAGLDPAKKDE